MKATERAIGAAMKIYRRSPLYPRAGKALAALLGRLPGRPTRAVKTIGGVSFDLDLTDSIGASLYYSGAFEEKTERLIESRLAPGMTAIDIGANFGYHTFRLAQGVGLTGRVLAIEPMAEAWHRLQANADRNNFSQITYVQVGLSESDQGVTSVAFTSHYGANEGEPVAPEDVRVTTLDLLVEELGMERVDFIKLDVDGYEGKVFRGARATLERWHPDVLFEMSPGMMAEEGDSAVDLLAMLDDLGYGLFDEDGKSVTDRAALISGTGAYSVNLLATTQPMG